MTTTTKSLNSYTMNKAIKEYMWACHDAAIASKNLNQQLTKEGFTSDSDNDIEYHFLEKNIILSEGIGGVHIDIFCIMPLWVALHELAKTGSEHLAHLAVLNMVTALDSTWYNDLDYTIYGDLADCAAELALQVMDSLGSTHFPLDDDDKLKALQALLENNRRYATEFYFDQVKPIFAEYLDSYYDFWAENQEY